FDFFFSSRRRHTRFSRDWSSDVCSSDLDLGRILLVRNAARQVLELPGGWVDPGEPPLRAAARELLEETGHAAGALEPAGWLRIRSEERRVGKGGERGGLRVNIKKATSVT